MRRASCSNGRPSRCPQFHLSHHRHTHFTTQKTDCTNEGKNGSTRCLEKADRHTRTFALSDNTTINDQLILRMEVAASRADHLPTLSAAKTSELSLLVKSPSWWLSGRCRQCYSDFLLQCAGDIEADHTDSGIVMDCADQNRETHLGD